MDEERLEPYDYDAMSKRILKDYDRNIDTILTRLEVSFTKEES